MQFSREPCYKTFKFDFSDVYQTQWKHQAKYGGVMISPDFRDLITRRAKKTQLGFLNEFLGSANPGFGTTTFRAGFQNLV